VLFKANTIGIAFYFVSVTGKEGRKEERKEQGTKEDGRKEETKEREGERK
jgi:hypothetical protein